MDVASFQVENTDTIPSPALLVWPDRVRRNIERMIDAVSGDLSRLRPHVKTHKMVEIVQMQAELGITKIKCATIAEAEICALGGATDVLLAHQPVGPGIRRFIELMRRYPAVNFAAIVDDLANAQRLASAGETVRLFVDIDTGMHRSGIAPGPEAAALCRWIEESEGADYLGLHAYDGHIYSPDQAGREAVFSEEFAKFESFLDELTSSGLAPRTIVGGGSPTFPLHADRFSWECSPGTTLLWDAGYSEYYPEMDFEIAAALLGRIISKPGSDLLTVDLGHKAVAAENALNRRVRFPGLPADATPVSQSEEHLVVRAAGVDDFSVGDVVYGIPTHICPTVALHQEAVLIDEEGRATGERWKVLARDRRIGV